MKTVTSPDPTKQLKNNENPTNAETDLLNEQERGSEDEPKSKQEETQPIAKQTDFGSEDVEKQIITNNPDEKEEIF